MTRDNYCNVSDVFVFVSVCTHWEIGNMRSSDDVFVSWALTVHGPEGQRTYQEWSSKKNALVANCRSANAKPCARSNYVRMQDARPASPEFKKS